jgi:hypothetical protein
MALPVRKFAIKKAVTTPKIANEISISIVVKPRRSAFIIENQNTN